MTKKWKQKFKYLENEQDFIKAIKTNFLKQIFKQIWISSEREGFLLK